VSDIWEVEERAGAAPRRGNESENNLPFSFSFCFSILRGVEIEIPSVLNRTAGSQSEVLCFSRPAYAWLTGAVGAEIFEDYPASTMADSARDYNHYHHHYRHH
jgi:hypothetical protein